MQNVIRWFFWPFLKSILKHYSVFGIYHVCNIIFQRSMCYHYNWKLNKVQFFGDGFVCLNIQISLDYCWVEPCSWVHSLRFFGRVWVYNLLKSLQINCCTLISLFGSIVAERCVMIGQNYLATNDGRSLVHLLI